MWSKDFSRPQYIVELVSCGQQYRKSVWAAKLFSSVTEKGMFLYILMIWSYDLWSNIFLEGERSEFNC